MRRRRRFFGSCDPIDLSACTESGGTGYAVDVVVKYQCSNSNVEKTFDNLSLILSSPFSYSYQSQLLFASAHKSALLLPSIVNNRSASARRVALAARWDKFSMMLALLRVLPKFVLLLLRSTWWQLQEIILQCCPYQTER